MSNNNGTATLITSVVGKDLLMPLIFQEMISWFKIPTIVLTETTFLPIDFCPGGLGDVDVDFFMSISDGGQDLRYVIFGHATSTIGEWFFTFITAILCIGKVINTEFKHLQVLCQVQMEISWCLQISMMYKSWLDRALIAMLIWAVSKFRAK